MDRIAFLSPLAPARTGIATYSATVLNQLRANGHLRGWRVDAPWPLQGTVDELVRSAHLAVYHLGNNAEFHRDIYRLAVRHPGLVVLHDLALDDLCRFFLDAGDPLGARAEAEADAGRERLIRARPDLEGPLEMPWCAHAARRARGLIVHSRFGRDYLEAFGCRTPVFVVPHPVMSPPRAARGAESAALDIRRRIADGVIIGVLGDIGEAKRIDLALEAAARLEGVHLAVVGRRIPGFDIGPVVAASGIGDRVTVLPDASEADFYAWLHASDIVVNLRDPHRGEVSGTLIRALGAGKPVVVRAVGSYVDWPEDAVVRVPGRRLQAADLIAALAPLLRDPSLRAAVGDRARALMEGQAHRRVTAAGYAEAIEATMGLGRDPVRAGAARWAAGLAQVGATEETVARGLGTGYVESLEEIAGASVPGVG